MIFKIYKILLDKFGPQGWWPTTPVGSTVPKYYPRRSVQGLSEKDMVEICLGAILTQNTNWGNVVKVLRGLSERGLLSVRALQDVPPRRMEKYLKSSGYFRQKARRVKTFLSTLFAETEGSIENYLAGTVPELRRKLLSLNGVGPETADSMILYAAGKPVFVVDAYTRRIASRWGVITGKDSYDRIQRVFMYSLPKSPDLFGEYHALLVELGKKICKKVPDCPSCPLKKMCEFGKRWEVAKPKGKSHSS